MSESSNSREPDVRTSRDVTVIDRRVALGQLELASLDPAIVAKYGLRAGELAPCTLLRLVGVPAPAPAPIKKPAAQPVAADKAAPLKPAPAKKAPARKASPKKG